jgi:ABC transporter substrate binding protein
MMIYGAWEGRLGMPWEDWGTFHGRFDTGRPEGGSSTRTSLALREGQEGAGGGVRWADQRGDARQGHRAGAGPPILGPASEIAENAVLRVLLCARERKSRMRCPTGCPTGCPTPVQPPADRLFRTRCPTVQPLSIGIGPPHTPLLSNRCPTGRGRGAFRYALPAMFPFVADVRAGGLISYGPVLNEVVRQCGVYTGRILKGEKPGDLPVVLPTKFEFVINLRTAKALGFQIPPDVLALADEVIE